MTEKSPYITIYFYFENGDCESLSSKLEMKEINKNTLEEGFNDLSNCDCLRGFDYIERIWKCIYFKNVRKILILVFNENGKEVKF